MSIKTLKFLILFMIASTLKTDSQTAEINALNEPPYDKYSLIQNGQPSQSLEKLIDQLEKTTNIICEDRSVYGINSYLQEKFLRKPLHERWQVQANIIDQHPEEFMPIFEEMGLTKTIMPKPGAYDYVILNGQSISMMRTQVMFLQKILNQSIITVKQVIFLTGDRPLNKDIDGQDPLFSECDSENEAANLLMQEYLKDYDCNLVVSRKFEETGGARRANTVDTIKEFLKIYKQEPNILMITCNPFIQYQFETLHAMLLTAQWIAQGTHIEKAGPEIISAYQKLKIAIISIMIDNIARTFFTEAKQRYPEQ